MTEYGSGPYLDEYWDFEIDPTGDIRSVSGIEELEKDLALAVAIELNDTAIGRVHNETTNTEIRKTVADVIAQDSRVSFVERDNVIVRRTGRNFVTVQAPVTTVDDDDIELVIEVER